MNIELLSIPKVNLDLFVNAPAQVLGRSMTRRLDFENHPVGSIGSFLGMLVSFEHENNLQRFNEALQFSGRLRDHLHFVFLVECPSVLINSILRATDLRVTSAEIDQQTSLNVISGTLTQWFVATINFCQESKNYEERLFGDTIVLVMEKLDLAGVWGEYRKQKIFDDKTFILQRKGR